MAVKYSLAHDVREKIYDMIDKLGLSYIDKSKVICIRSVGSSSKMSFARVHGLPRIWQKALGKPAFYIIEVVEERFDMLGEYERERVLIHELLHIPKSFQGGFRPHKRWVSRKRVDEIHRKYLQLKCKQRS
ncbi:MAG: putative metallopeptidase [Candidatus Bathyarchaeia archaeon]